MSMCQKQQLEETNYKSRAKMLDLHANTGAHCKINAHHFPLVKHRVSKETKPTVNQANFKASKCDHLLQQQQQTSEKSLQESTNKQQSSHLHLKHYHHQDVEKKEKLIRVNCDHCSFISTTRRRKWFKEGLSSLLTICLLLLLVRITEASNGNHSTIILDQPSFSGAQLLPTNTNQQQQTAQTQAQQERQQLIGAHLQPSYVYGARNRSINFTHMAVDELTGSIYLGATNWLFQLSASNLRPEFVLKTGPASENSRDCAPADCVTQIGHIDAQSLPMHHAHGPDMSVPNSLFVAPLNNQLGLRRTMHTTLNGTTTNNLTPLRASPGSRVAAAAGANLPPAQQAPQQISPQQQAFTNNYNKILAIDQESRQLIVCGSLNQGACRRHQLGQLANFTDLIPLPVASNDEHSSNVALITAPTRHQRPIMYVAATNTRLGPYREMVPAISARYLDPASRAMQIIERSFTDSARIDVSFELRDYYLVNYVYTFQHNDYIYFATVQRKSPLRQLEEWGYITRLARLCLSDLSFQSYTELTLECRSSSSSSSSFYQNHHSPAGDDNQQKGANNKSVGGQQTNSINYNLLQDAQLTTASSQLAQQLGLRPQAQVLIGAFAQSKDHTTKSQQKSAICLFPMEKIEQKFNENIQQCYNGTSKARNMNYIAGSVNDCPKPGAGNIANFCNEPLKLNGSLPLQASPVISYDNELITSIISTQANTSPINMKSGEFSASIRRHSNSNSNSNQQNQHHHHHQQRQHQVLIAGTSEGALKRIVLIDGSGSSSSSSLQFGSGVKGLEFDSVQLDSEQQPILADLHLWPTNNPQLNPLPVTNGETQQTGSVQYALAVMPHKVAKLRVNACKLIKSPNNNTNSAAADTCQQCAQLQDPFCGWCSTSGSCSTREECLSASVSSSAHSTPIHWSPFDQVRCADYQPIAPQFVALQASANNHQQPVDVNIRINKPQLASVNGASSMALQLTQAQFQCHFDYLTLSNRSLPMPRITGATTKATQPRLNLHTSTVTIGCPLPPPNQRPPGPLQESELRVKLSVKPVSSIFQTEIDRVSGSNLQQSLGLEELGDIERELSFYDCSVHTSCRTCLQSSTNSRYTNRILNNKARWHCSWCPLSNRCTFNSSHPDFGCAASAIISTTPHSVLSTSSNSVRPSHLAPSLDQAQASVFGLSIDTINQCPSIAGGQESQAEETQINQYSKQSSDLLQNKQQQQQQKQPKSEILIPNNSRRSLQVSLVNPQLQATINSQQNQQQQKRGKLECLLEVEGAKFRVSARWLPAVGDNNQQQVVCQESSFSYQEEVATLRAQLYVIMNENQVIDVFDVILYKCHLFGVNPPALTSTIGLSSQTQQPSSAAWRAHELFQLAAGGAGPTNQATNGQLFRRQAPQQSHSDCSLCLNVERKYQCVWCSNQCQYADQCTDLQASTCPPPRIDSIHPTSGPLEGGTLLTIEGSNLGSNEREIQDKITVGGEACQLVMYSVSTRIVCKTGPSQHGPQAATVFVGNRAGVTSAYEKFHYKAVHLTDVHPRIGPVSGGTRLYLTGSNLNIGSRVQIFLDDIPCSLDSAMNNDNISSQQITCITAPNLVAATMRITRLTLMIDNSTHHLPYPFTYLPDPIITSIEPAESFVSGGRLILISGHHLSSPQSIKLMVYHEHKHNIMNATTCTTQNDTLITCLTPALSREMLTGLMVLNNGITGGGPLELSSLGGNDIQQQTTHDSLSYDSGGLKLKMSLFMDDVRSVRNLDEYYHHLPHYLTYFEDPQLFRLTNSVVEHSDELVIAGENLQMRQLEQDMLITIGFHTCPIKSITANQVVCLPPKRVRPVYDELGRQLERAQLPIVVLVGSNLKYQVGHMQYNSRQYDPLLGGNTLPGSSIPDPSTSLNNQMGFLNSMASYPPSSNSAGNSEFSSLATQHGIDSPSVAILIILSVVGFIIGIAATFVFAVSRFRQSKAEREYKRIQLQMGSLDVNGQPFNGSLFDNIHLSNNNNNMPTNGMRSRALDYVGGAFSGKKLFYHFNHQLPSFPPSPLTDISSLTGSSHQTNGAAFNQHVVKLSSNGTIINSINHHHSPTYHHYQSANSNSSQSSPGSSTRASGTATALGNQQTLIGTNGFGLANQQQQPQLLQSLDKSSGNPLNSSLNQSTVNGGTRNFSWTQEAPSTIVPYSVIEACNLSLEGKGAIKDYV